MWTWITSHGAAAAVGVLVAVALPLVVLAYYRLRLRLRGEQLMATLSELSLEREYIRVFHLGQWKDLLHGSEQKIQQQFRKLFMQSFLGGNRFGNFVVPLLLLSITTFAFGLIAYLSLRSHGPTVPVLGALSRTALPLAIAGATLYVFRIATVKYATLSLNPHLLLDLIGKLWLATAVGVLLATTFSQTLEPIAAFLGGLLPVWALETLTKKLDQGKEQRRSDLHDLARGDEDLLAQLEYAGVRTVTQLAYTNPLRLFLATELSLPHCVDLVDQAYLQILVPDEEIRKGLNLLTIRTATDIMTQTYEEGPDGEWGFLPYEATLEPHLETALAAIAAKMKLSGVPELRNVIGMMIDNPQIGYLHQLWQLMPDQVAELAEDDDDTVDDTPASTRRAAGGG
jgi:hypothetical protein